MVSQDKEDPELELTNQTRKDLDVRQITFRITSRSDAGQQSFQEVQLYASYLGILGVFAIRVSYYMLDAQDRAQDRLRMS